MLTDENVQVLRLVIAMVGAVSPNFRRVSLEVVDARKVHLWFLLAHDHSEDREEIDDIAFEFESLQDRGIELETTILVDARPVEQLALPGRVVFGRREATPSRA
ncbi:hypothetical protein [Nannocystis punicea]|uniref:Uncharacterized protein n=1 Tax=Nannocystis punicea TaxID=2995304 RepID=A0ABY7H1M7_9BACT|nr:hypothetical protein [Nannocystis poenicansa]WAS93143.1 hypothetical protein O0S08_43830 [Nannocystis poenicansa]